MALPALAARRLWPAALSRLAGQGRPPKRTPRDPWPGDSGRGQALLNDGEGLARLLQETPETPGALARHRFVWLRDLRGIGGDQARREARRLVSLWLDAHGSGRGSPWRADIAGARLFAWIGSHEFFAGSADDAFRSRLASSMALHARLLARPAEAAAPGAARLAALTGALAGAVAFDRPLAALLRRIEAEIRAQFFEDGFHRSRNPVEQLAALRRLIEMRGLLRAADCAPPEALLGAIRRAGPPLAFFRLGDRRLACFHGGHEADGLTVELTLARARQHVRPPSRSVEAGFDRLQAGRTVMLVDSGAPAADLFANGGHASPLAFEFGDGNQRIVVNCGAPPEGGPPFDELARATAAHSALVVNDVHAFEIEPGGEVLADGVAVSAERLENEQGVWLDLAHEGYRAPFGLVHRRRLYLAREGGDVRGEDLLDGRAGWPFALRFHLHPDVKARLDAGAVQLALPKGRIWRFRAGGGRLGLGASVYLGGGGERETVAITVEGRTGAGGALVKWAFRAVAE